jgi:hypothetical protein
LETAGGPHRGVYEAAVVVAEIEDQSRPVEQRIEKVVDRIGRPARALPEERVHLEVSPAVVQNR